MRRAHLVTLLLMTVACGGEDARAVDPGSDAPDASPLGDAGSTKDPGPEAGDASSGDAGADASVGTTVALNIPAREQWPNGGGYCGETSIQSIALFYGAWISQAVVRDVAGGEVLLGVNDAKALDALHFAHASFSSTASQPQYQGFMQWMKGELALGVPCIYGVYLTDGTNDPDYDHIMPATGVEFLSLATYDPNDRLTFNDNFGDRLTRDFGTLSGTRASCAFSSTQGGCVPLGVDFGIAVTGIVDAQHVTLPVSVSVPLGTEPNVSKGANASPMTATVTVSRLTVGGHYALLRYDDRTKVPTNASAAEFLASGFTHRTDFTAAQATWTLQDPSTFASDGAVYYRCVPRP